jgi:hypothetical protein
MDTLGARSARSAEQACAEQWRWCLGNRDIQKPEDQHRMGWSHEEHDMELISRWLSMGAGYGVKRLYGWLQPSNVAAC